ncbi:MAG: zinc ribbon domain-containing protein [Ignavibacteriaceae bacterium]|nr:zinc ribbon domain-containing protein [Ignavibacteriaceae bacterium]
MPVFEYKCSSCNTKFEVLHKSSGKQDEVTCPECDSKTIKKLFSSFSPSVHTHSLESPCSQGNCNIPSGGCGCAGGACSMN